MNSYNDIIRILMLIRFIIFQQARIGPAPAPVFGRERLRELKLGCLCVDVASVQGIDLAAAEELGLPNIWARMLPGKLMPRTAGRIIRDTVYTIIKEQGVML